MLLQEGIDPDIHLVSIGWMNGNYEIRKDITDCLLALHETPRRCGSFQTTFLSLCFE